MNSLYPLDFFLEPMKPARPPQTPGGRKKLQAAMTSNDYVAEEKIDGCHYLSLGGRIFSPRVSNVTSVPVEKTDRVPHITEALSELGPKLILDGEIYVPGGKAPDVVSIMGSDPSLAIAKQEVRGKLQFMLFDILRLPDGTWIHYLPWVERRAHLIHLFETALTQIDDLKISPLLEGNRQQLLEEIWDKGREGLVLKRKNSPYFFGQRPAWNWIKLKPEFDDDVVILGFKDPDRLYTGNDYDNWHYWETPQGVIVGQYTAAQLGNCVPVSQHYAKGLIGSIIFGKYDAPPSLGGKLVQIGTCSGFNETVRRQLTEAPDAYLGRVIKIRAMEKTSAGAYRHSKFIAFHADKNPKECVLKALN